MIGIVLAGGKSTRMGTNKALLKVGNQLMIDRQIELLANLGATDVLVSGNYPGYHCLNDQIEGLGPLSGIHAAMEFAANKTIILIPVDLPLLTVDTLQPLVDRLATTDSACYHKAWLPLAIRSTETLRRHVAEQYQKGNYSIANLCRVMGTDILCRPTTEHLFNTNTPEEWQHSLSLI